MKGCTYSATLESIIGLPTGLLVLHGHDGDEDGAKPGTSEEDGTKDEKSKGTNGKDEDNDEGKDDEKSKKPEDRELANAKEALARNVDKRKEAEEKLKEANSKIAKLEKDGTTDEAAANRLKEQDGQIAKLQEVNRALSLRVAFYESNEQSWVNPARALQLADLSEVEIDEDGSVHGLGAALDKLAKSDPYLLKPKEEPKEEEPKKKAPVKTGTPPKPGAPKDSDRQAREAELRKRYPGLRR